VVAAAAEHAGREVASLPSALLDLEAHGPAPVEVTASLLEQCDRLAASHSATARSA